MNKEYSNSFLRDCKDANEELSYYIKNNLSINDFKNTGIIGYGGDETKKIDEIAEEIFVKYLLKYANIISEESGLIKSNSKNIISKSIILDPLDGSNNILCALPYYGTSVALKINNKTQIAFIYNLVNDTYFFKTPYENNIKQLQYEKPKLAIFERAYSRIDVANQLTKLNIKFRSPGATALSLANAINYEYVLLAGKLRDEDISAALYICEDLNILQTHNFLLISKNISTFNQIKEIIKDI